MYTVRLHVSHAGLGSNGQNRPGNSISRHPGDHCDHYRGQGDITRRRHVVSTRTYEIRSCVIELPSRAIYSAKEHTWKQTRAAIKCAKNLIFSNAFRANGREVYDVLSVCRQCAAAAAAAAVSSPTNNTPHKV